MLITDDFNRIDNASLGANWLTRVGGTDAFKIISNSVQPTVFSGTDAVEFYSAVAFGADQYSQVALSGLSGTNNLSGQGVAVRVRPDNIGGGAAYITLYAVVVGAQGSNNVTIVKFVANTFTVLAQLTQAWSDGDVLRLEVRGTTLRVYRNGAKLGADIVDADIATGAPGLVQLSPMTAGTLDSWQGGDPGPLLYWTRAKARRGRRFTTLTK